jgi:hypothetical protein
MHRLNLWRQSAIAVKGRPDWLFIKLHCHGMNPDDEDAMLGDKIQHFLQELTTHARQDNRFNLHFVTAREMVNIVLAACDGLDGNPGDYRDYRLRLMKESRTA